MKYAVCFDRTGTGYGASVPDLPGCIGAGATLEEARENIESAIKYHIESLHKHGEPVPQPETIVEFLDVETSLKASA